MELECFWLFPPGECLYIREELLIKYKSGTAQKAGMKLLDMF